MNEPKSRRPVAVREALQSYLARTGLERRLAQAQVVPEWPRLVGPQIAKVTEPESVTADGTLFVRVAARGASRRYAGFSHARDLWPRPNLRPLKHPKGTATTKPTRSRSSRDWRRCGVGRRCTSARCRAGGCTTWSTRWWTTRSTRRWRAI